MSSLLTVIESFNRKERFFLVAAALDNPRLRLGRAFRQRLGTALRLDIPSSALVAMDYHLDWLWASLCLARSSAAETVVLRNRGGLVTGHQEDVDLLVAFETGRTTRLILIEAKVETGWSNRQMSSKAGRLRRMFGDDGRGCRGVRPYFVLMSPRQARDLRSSEWPSWMAQRGQPVWLELKLPPDRRRVARCDGSGRTSGTGRFFRVLS
ncbi:MAG: hypothetical protein HY905_15780 [Deltaproteobacteria bacterium]|nr:hypothetical protein [Deltaproteobacteria bacterium]